MVGRSGQDCQAKVYEGFLTCTWFMMHTCLPSSTRCCHCWHWHWLLTPRRGCVYPARQQATSKVVEKEKPVFDALGGKGTTKRSRQLRQFMQDQLVASDEDDIFDADGGGKGLLWAFDLGLEAAFL